MDSNGYSFAKIKEVINKNGHLGFEPWKLWIYLCDVYVYKLDIGVQTMDVKISSTKRLCLRAFANCISIRKLYAQTRLGHMLL